MMRVVAILSTVAAALALSGCGGGSGCEDLSFPAPPDGAGDPVFVAGTCSSDGADGSRNRPYPSLAAAVEKAPSGATILVAAETSYDEQLVIDRPLRILASPAGSNESDATVTLRPTTGPGVIVTSGAKDVVIRGLRIERPKGAGVWVTEGAAATIEATTVRDAEPDGDGHFGYGLLASGGATAVIRRTTVDGAAEVGIYIQGATGTLDEVSVADVSGRGGIRLEDATGTVAISNTAVESSAEVGILVASSTATITASSVASNILGASGIADGIVVTRRKGADGAYLGEARADIDGAVISQVGRVGVLFSDGATGSLTDSTVTHCGTKAGQGAGVWLQLGAGGDEGVLLTKNRIRANGFLAIGVSSGSRARVIDNPEVNDSQSEIVSSPGTFWEVGDGIGVFDGAWADIESNVVDHHPRFGILLEHAAEGTIVKSNFIGNNGMVGLVIQHPDGEIPAFADNQFLNNGEHDFLVLGPNEPGFGAAAGDFVTP